jgi:hypothetical protein
MKTGIFGVLTVIILLCLACGSTGSSGMGDYGPANEIKGDYWFHVTKPLTLKSLKGKVILIDVWQFT